MAKPLDPAILAHLEWIGFVRPTGLVFSAPALVRAGAILPRSDAEGQRLLLAGLVDPEAERPAIADFRHFAQTVLGWSFSPKGYAGVDGAPIPPELCVTLPEYGETLMPDLAVRELEPANGATPWQLLVQLRPRGERFDQITRGHGRFEASAHSRMERLLRQSGVSAGLLCNGEALRLISAPRGESSGWLDFSVADMRQTAGRPIIAALRLLLSQQRLLSLPRAQRLAALLEDSRKFQNTVSERLAEQVLHALYALLRGFQAADDETRGALLRETLRDEPDQVYRGLLTVVLRLVFLLYAEERDMLPADETFLRGYSLAGLHERLREDAALYPDTMQQRYGAWAQLVALFRMIYDGVAAGELRLPRRHGALFDPERFPFLEGRAAGSSRQQHQRLSPPRVPDGTVYAALEQLLLLDGERISYRALDVEQIGSVYETMMGFRLEAATGRSLAIRAGKKGGAPTTVSLDALLETAPAQRAKWLQEQTERSIPAGVGKALPGATSIEALHAALRPIVEVAATPDIVPPGAMVLQPSPERRRSGSHYTPRELTEPIVRTTLEPILTRLRGADGLPPRPSQILDLKVCDPAMGSGAFLVETCRQLGDALIEAWRAHGERPPVPPDEDEVIFARRLIAQRCLYGVDKNPTAVDLAKVSLWLVTLAKEHPFTFVDHALRHGDSLVGLSQRQIAAFHWQDDARPRQEDFYTREIRAQVEQAADLRAQIRYAGDGVGDATLRGLWRDADEALARVRLYGDLAVAAFFEGKTTKERESQRLRYAEDVREGRAAQHRARLAAWRDSDLPLVPFHWEIEFPEVFQRANPGFDAVVGNPPFLGGARIWPLLGNVYPDWLREIHENSGGKAVDLVAHFFRRAFILIRNGGVFGLIATNTVAQGDTRTAGLKQICRMGGHIYAATRRLPWPGLAAVIISVIHISKAKEIPQVLLNGKQVRGINSFLLPHPEEFEAERLVKNLNLSFSGCKIYGQGFIFSEEDNTEIAGDIKLMNELIRKDNSNSTVLYPYIGGKELVTHPRHEHHRYAINFAELSLSESMRWPDLLAIVAEKVKPEREKLGGYSVADRRREYWWQYGTYTPALYKATEGVDLVLAISQTTTYLCFAFLPSRMVFSHKLIIFPALGNHFGFSLVQSRVHEVWALMWGSTLEDRRVYSTPDCFETFPFPKDWETHPALNATGKEYYEFRATLMVRNNQGMTDTYNRFHDPFERNPEIERLRELHAAMDRAVFDAYGWHDIPTDCEFLLDYEIDEEEWGSKKKPYRYRWPDDVRDEVLARLLELNVKRAQEEKLAGEVKSKGAGKRRKQPEGMRDMFEE